MRLFLFWGCSLLRALLSHHAKVVLGVLVAVLGLNDVTASRRVLSHRGVALVIVAGVLRRVTASAWGANTGWPLLRRSMTLRSLATIVPVRAELLSAWTLVQVDLRCDERGRNRGLRPPSLLVCNA